MAPFKMQESSLFLFYSDGFIDNEYVDSKVSPSKIYMSLQMTI